MQSISRNIIIAGMSMAVVSILYFLALVLHVPFVAAVIIIALAVGFMVRYLVRLAPEFFMPGNTKKQVWTLLIFIGGVALMIQKSYACNLRYGGWDAWAIWNLHARYMALGADGWQTIFVNKIGHPDYPLLYPGLNGFFMRLFAPQDLIAVPFIVSFTFTLLIAVLLFSCFARRNLVVASAVLFILAQDVFYLSNGVSEYADIVIAFFFLCALVAVDKAKLDSRYIAVSTFCIGCCAWTKNEGMLLGVVFILSFMRTFFSKRNWKYSLFGMSLPLLVLIIHKVFFAPANDMMEHVGNSTISHLWVASRYELLWKYFAKNIDDNMAYLKPALIGYLLICIIQKKLPSAKMLSVILCLLAYLSSYILLSQDQAFEWQLDTSLGRLLIQLMPAMLYALADKFSDVQLVLAKQRAQ